MLRWYKQEFMYNFHIQKKKKEKKKGTVVLIFFFFNIKN